MGLLSISPPLSKKEQLADERLHLTRHHQVNFSSVSAEVS